MDELLEQIKKEFEEVQNQREPMRSRRLAKLMTRLEQNYEDVGVAFTKDKQSEEFKLYLEISKARE